MRKCVKVYSLLIPREPDALVGLHGSMPLSGLIYTCHTSRAETLFDTRDHLSSVRQAGLCLLSGARIPVSFIAR